MKTKLADPIWETAHHPITMYNMKTKVTAAEQREAKRNKTRNNENK